MKKVQINNAGTPEERTAKLMEILDGRQDLRRYLFRRGFLLTDDPDIRFDAFPFYGQWQVQQAGGYSMAFHPDLKPHAVRRPVQGKETWFILFGHCCDPFRMDPEEESILEGLAEAYGSEEFQDRIDGLTGIFVLCVVTENGAEYQVDPSGMQSACSGTVNGHFYLSSHPQLVGDICGLKMGSFQKELTEYKWYYRVMGPYLPADLTPFDELKRIVPDIAYCFDREAGKITHRRFYPLRPIEMAEDSEHYDEVIRQGADILRRSMQLTLQKWEKSAVSLTGGIDSNTTFAAANGMYDRLTAFSYVSAEKEIRDMEAARKIAERFRVPHTVYEIPDNADSLEDFQEICEIIDHGNGYVARGVPNEYRKRVYLMKHLDADVEIKSWVSETIRAYWYKHYGRTSMPPMSAKLFRNLYKIFLLNRSLAHRIDRLFADYIREFEYDRIPEQYPPADMHYNEVTWGSWGGLNISEMKIYSNIAIIYNNRKFLDLMFRVPLEKRISDQHHLDLKKELNSELYDMNIRVVNMKETDMRAFLLNIIFTVNTYLPF